MRHGALITTSVNSGKATVFKFICKMIKKIQKLI